MNQNPITLCYWNVTFLRSIKAAKTHWTKKQNKKNKTHTHKNIWATTHKSFALHFPSHNITTPGFTTTHDVWPFLLGTKVLLSEVIGGDRMYLRRQNGHFWELGQNQVNSCNRKLIKIITIHQSLKQNINSISFLPEKMRPQKNKD